MRHDVVDKTGAITLRPTRGCTTSAWGHGTGGAASSCSWHLDIRLLDEDGELLRHLTLDPTRDYQRQDSG